MRNKTQHRLHLAAPRLNEMKLLQCLASDPNITQAELARRCGLSVAMVNNYMKDLCAAGLLVYHRKSSKNISYHLTTAGSMRAEEIGQELLQEMVESFAMAKERIRNLILSQVPPGPLRVVLYGLDDLAVIAFHALDCRDLRIVGVCDDDPGKNRPGMVWARGIQSVADPVPGPGCGSDLRQGAHRRDLSQPPLPPRKRHPTGTA